MGVKVHDSNSPACLDVAEEMSIRSFMSTAEDDGHCAAVEDRRDYLAEDFLAAFQRAFRPHVANVKRRQLGEIDVAAAVPGCQTVKESAGFPGRLSGSDPAAVSPHSLIDRKSNQHSAAWFEGRRIALPGLYHFAQARIVCAAGHVWRLHRLKPRIPLGRA
jgi:hypothetical protein